MKKYEICALISTTDYTQPRVYTPKQKTKKTPRNKNETKASIFFLSAFISSVNIFFINKSILICKNTSYTYSYFFPIC